MEGSDLSTYSHRNQNCVINTVELAEEIRTELANGVSSVQRKGKLIKRLRLLDS